MDKSSALLTKEDKEALEWQLIHLTLRTHAHDEKKKKAAAAAAAAS